MTTTEAELALHELEEAVRSRLAEFQKKLFIATKNSGRSSMERRHIAYLKKMIAYYEERLSELASSLSGVSQ